MTRHLQTSGISWLNVSRSISDNPIFIVRKFWSARFRFGKKPSRRPTYIYIYTYNYNTYTVRKLTCLAGKTTRKICIERKKLTIQLLS